MKVPAIVSDHMVVQANGNPRIWGTAAPFEKVKVSFLKESREVTADQGGNWQVFLGKLAPGSTFDLHIDATNELVIHDVLVGEVWLCSGQSNMIMPLCQVNAGIAELQIKPPPTVRFFRVAEQHPAVPLDDVDGKWEVFEGHQPCKWSAVGYFFAKKLSGELKEPVGMIESGYGGAQIQQFMSGLSLKGLPAHMLQIQKNGIVPDFPPSTLFNGMINGLRLYELAGILWYQGESNVREAQSYRNLFPAMISDWRRVFDVPNLPFLFVQLPNYDSSKSKGQWCDLRDAQTSALKTRDTAMVVTVDTSDGTIHPRNKEPVGERLALAALAVVYKKPVVYQGPMLESVEKINSVVVCRFKPSTLPLKIGKGSKLSGFEICGPDMRYFPAVAVLKENEVVVASRPVVIPVGVRYDWSDNPDGNLVNGHDLPAAPFSASVLNFAAAQKSAADIAAMKQRYRQQMIDQYKAIQMKKHAVK